MLALILARLSEGSTWAGVSAALGTTATSVDAPAIKTGLYVACGVAAVVAAVLPERKAAE